MRDTKFKAGDRVRGMISGSPASWGKEMWVEGKFDPEEDRFEDLIKIVLFKRIYHDRGGFIDAVWCDPHTVTLVHKPILRIE